MRISFRRDIGYGPSGAAKVVLPSRLLINNAAAAAAFRPRALAPAAVLAASGTSLVPPTAITCEDEAGNCT
ncbi:MAG: hypothetical protein ACJ8EL_21295, partial [Rhizomicrobium sp.]